MNYVKSHTNTILIVTADHETGGIAYVSDNLDDTLPSVINTEEENRTIRMIRINQLGVSWKSGGHTRRNVPFFAYEDAFENITDISLIDNTDIFGVMNSYIFSEEISLVDRLPIRNISMRIIIIVVIFSHSTLLITITSIMAKRKNKSE